MSNDIHTPNQITAKVAYEVRKATLAERERIIKLLEDPYSLLGSSIAHWQFGCDYEAKLQAFEIIRGENK